MLFNSINFIIFLMLVVVGYYLLPSNTIRKVYLLSSSYFFYACYDWRMLFILLYETLLSYGYGRISIRFSHKMILMIMVVLLLLPLLCFKYLTFLISILNDLFLTNIFVSMPSFEFFLPVGISFYTFMALGYVVDVYRKSTSVEKNLLDYALFIGFFPHISSGPIGRASLLIPQFKVENKLLYRNIQLGACMMLWGFFMKMVVGDRAGIYVNTIFENYEMHNGGSLILATFMYSIQIYCDFAGYSLVAIGAARMLGYELMQNFMRPYFSVSIKEFWRRWHVSLSTWFRDYVYIPCGGSRCSKLKSYRNILVTFLVSGLWHGAGYNFIIWGGVSWIMLGVRAYYDYIKG